MQLIVVAAFDADPETGELLQAVEPVQADSAERAVRLARELAAKHAGAIAWSRSADPTTGDYGESTVLYQSGDVPELE